MSFGRFGLDQPPWEDVNRSRATGKEQQANTILGDPKHGLSIDEIAELLLLQKSSVITYLAQPRRRADLFHRLFEDDQRVKARALTILSERRAVSGGEAE
jgi:hypothetical protein